ncbi:MAG: hypothetical protein ACRERD_00020 [Candidatus Binatia bacterium]
MKATFLTLLLTWVVFGSSGSLSWAQEENVASASLPVSAAHSLFGDQCALCHVDFKGVSEDKCQACHAGPLHTTAQAFTPSCVSCHVEHKGLAELAQVADTQCAACHTDLRTKDDSPLRFAKKVTSFAQDHPEFAIPVTNGATPKRLRLDESGARQSDNARVKFTHEVHLKADLKGPKGPVQLACKNCHVPAADGRQMAPVTYEMACKDCHELVFDPRFPDRAVPHVLPEDVRAYLLLTFAEGRDRPPPPAPERGGRLTRPAPSLPVASSPQSVQAVEKVLYSVTCVQCHELERSSRRLPRIQATAIPAVWFPHAQFAHKAHRMLGCASCHVDVEKSGKTKDILLPGIEVCRQCHSSGAQKAGAQQNSTLADCVTCHVYHDKSTDVEWNGPFTIQRALTEGRPERKGQPEEKPRRRARPEGKTERRSQPVPGRTQP